MLEQLQSRGAGSQLCTARPAAGDLHRGNVSAVDRVNGLMVIKPSGGSMT